MLRTALSTLATVRRFSCATPRRYKLYLRLLKNPGPRIAMVEALERGDVDLLAAGFPRSGNTYLTWLIKRAFPDLAFAHHLHNTAALELAWTHQLPTYTPFRSPEDSVASLVLKNINARNNFYRFDLMRGAHRNPAILSEIYLKDYLHYHRKLLQHSDKTILFQAEFLFREPSIVLRHIAEAMGVSSDLFSDDYCNTLTDDYFKTKRAQSEKSTLAGGMPSAEKSMAKEKIMHQHINSNPLYKKCTETHKRLIKQSSFIA